MIDTAEYRVVSYRTPGTRGREQLEVDVGQLLFAEMSMYEGSWHVGLPSPYVNIGHLDRKQGRIDLLIRVRLPGTLAGEVVAGENVGEWVQAVLDDETLDGDWHD